MNYCHQELEVIIDNSKKSGFNCNCLWEIQPCDPIESGAIADIKGKFRIKHIATGLFLTWVPNDQKKLIRLSQPTDYSIFDIKQKKKKTDEVSFFFCLI